MVAERTDEVEDAGNGGSTLIRLTVGLFGLHCVSTCSIRVPAPDRKSPKECWQSRSTLKADERRTPHEAHPLSRSIAGVYRN